MTSDYILSNLPRVELDPRNEQEVLAKAIATTASASQGQLTDFSVSSVAGSILKGAVFAQMELKWFLNKVVVAIAVELLRLFGVTRDLGTASTGQVTCVLKNTLLTPFVLPQGYRFPFKGSDTGSLPIDLVTTEQLTIQPGGIFGKVGVVASRVGADTNIDKLSFYTQGVGAYLAYVYNEDDINGGTDIEPLEETVARGQRAIRQRQTLVTVPEYEDAARSFLGFGSQATAFPAMGGDKKTGQPGNVHVICALPNGKVPNSALCSALQQSLASRSFATAVVWVSAYTPFPVSLDLVVNVNALTDVDDTTILNVVKDYLFSLTLGKSIPIKELEFVIRSIPGIVGIQYVTINGDALTTPMPDKVSAPKLAQLILTKTDINNITVTTYPQAIIDPD